jgi:hypothetical protein
MIEAGQPVPSQQVRQLIGPGLVVAIRDGLAGRRHDERRSIGMKFRVTAWIHAQTVA